MFVSHGLGRTMVLRHESAGVTALVWQMRANKCNALKYTNGSIICNLILKYWGEQSETSSIIEEESRSTRHYLWLIDDFHFLFFFSYITTTKSEIGFHPLFMTWSSHSLHISLAISKIQNAREKKKPTGDWLMFLAHGYLYVTREQSIPDVIPAESLKLGHGWVFTHYYWGGR